MSDNPPIEFIAQVARVQTMADGGLRFTLDAPETCIMQAAALMEFKRFGVAVEINVTPVNLTELDDATQQEAEGSGSSVDNRRITLRRNK